MGIFEGELLLPGEPVLVRAVRLRDWHPPLKHEVDRPVAVEEVWQPAVVTHASHYTVSVAFEDGRLRAFERADVRRAVANDVRGPS